tara:strand:- start:3426 stop:3803 length:378 start_codon:yes stop_codon:yes gene_type:complete
MTTTTKKDPVLPWNQFPEGKLIQYKNLWVVRTGVVVNRPKKSTKWKDKHVELTQLKGQSSAVLGYTFEVKRKFEYEFYTDTFVSFINQTDEHNTPEYLYKDPKMHLLSFNGKKLPNYWLLVRYRP